MSAGKPGFERRASGTCWACGKTSFRSRSLARSAARKIHPGEKMHAYRCGLYWHYGHDEVWRDRLPDDLLWAPLPMLARRQINHMRRVTLHAVHP